MTSDGDSGDASDSGAGAPGGAEGEGGAPPAPDVRVRPATLDDLDALADSWVALVESQRPHGAHLRAAENREMAREVLGQQVTAGNVFVARTGAGVAGFVTCSVETGAYAQDAVRGVVNNIYVRPSFRERGVGSRLLDAAEAALRDAGAEVFAISALADNDTARRLYEERGYRPHRVTYERPADRSDTHTGADDG